MLGALVGQNVSMDPAIWLQTFIILGMLTVIWKNNIVFRIASFTVVGLLSANSLCTALDTINDGALQLAIGGDFIYFFVIILAALSIFRLSEPYGWIARFPTAFILGLGLSLAAGPMARVLLEQIQAQSQLVIGEGGVALFNGLLSLVACVTTMIYFVFTSKIRRNPAISGIATIGRYFFMIAVGGLCGVYVVGNFQYQGQALQYIVIDFLGFQSA
jgi:hypothetical protein